MYLYAVAGATNDDPPKYLIKVGITSGEPETRLRQLQTGCPYTLHLIVKEDVKDEAVEQVASFASWFPAGDPMRMQFCRSADAQHRARASQIEQHILTHTRYRSYRVEGEWFSFDSFDEAEQFQSYLREDAVRDYVESEIDKHGQMIAEYCWKTAADMAIGLEDVDMDTVRCVLTVTGADGRPHEVGFSAYELEHYPEQPATETHARIRDALEKCR